MSKNLTYNVEQRGTSYCIIDSTGALCGIHDTQANAEAAIPKIAYNISKGRLPQWFMKLIDRKQNRQVSNKVWTNKYNKKPRNK